VKLRQVVIGVGTGLVVLVGAIVAGEGLRLLILWAAGY
jgi:hypothetical protein